MKLVFMTKQNSKAPKLTKTSTPMFLYKPYISKHKLEDMRTLEYYIKLGLVDESVHNLYELLSNAIREFCKANNITTFTIFHKVIKPKRARHTCHSVKYISFIHSINGKKTCK